MEKCFGFGNVCLYSVASLPLYYYYYDYYCLIFVIFNFLCFNLKLPEVKLTKRCNIFSISPFLPQYMQIAPPLLAHSPFFFSFFQKIFTSNFETFLKITQIKLSLYFLSCKSNTDNSLISLQQSYGISNYFSYLSYLQYVKKMPIWTVFL